MRSTVSIARRINGERLMLLAWPRAILMQLAHPLVAAGVADHSAFRQNRVVAARRLHSTVRSMLSLVFGAPDAQAATIERIRGIHRRVHGELSEATGAYAAGTRYSAEDPALLLWVHVTLMESVVMAYEEFVEPLTAGERDSYVWDARWVPVALGARAADVPESWPALQQTMRAYVQSDRIAVGRTARDLAPAVMKLPAPLILTPITWAARVVTWGALPESIRAQYGCVWTPRDAQRLARATRWLRMFRRATPRAVALWPEARRMDAAG